MKYWAMFENGKHTGFIQRDDTQAAPPGGIEVDAALFGQRLTLVNGVPAVRGADDIAAEQSALTVALARSTALQLLDQHFAQAMGAIKAGYPADEVLSWDQQLREALVYTADHTATTPLLSALSAARGLAEPDLVAKITTNAAAYAAISGAIIGNHQKLRMAIDAAPDMATLTAIDVAAGWPVL